MPCLPKDPIAQIIIKHDSEKKDKIKRNKRIKKKKEIKLLLSLDGLKDPSFTKASLTKTNPKVITHSIVVLRRYFPVLTGNYEYKELFTEPTEKSHGY